MATGFRETLGKGSSITFKNGTKGIAGQLYIQDSRIYDDMENGRLQVQKTVELLWSMTFAQIGMKNPLTVSTLSKEETRIDPITGLEMVRLRSGGRRNTAVKICIANEWFPKNVDAPAMVDEEGTVWVPINFTKVEVGTAEDLFMQIQDNSHKEWSALSLINTCGKLIDVLKTDAEGNKITAEMVAGKVGVKRTVVQQYLRIYRSGDVFQKALEGTIPQTVDVLDYLGIGISRGKFTLDHALKVITDLEEQKLKVTKNRLKAMLFPEEAREKVEGSVQTGSAGASSILGKKKGSEDDTTGNKKEDLDETGGKKKEDKDTDDKDTTTSFNDLITITCGRLQNGIVKDVLKAVLEAKKKKLDVEDFLELLSEIDK